MPISGVILIDKPKGISSNTVVNIVKHALKAKKAGHLGTLDVAGHGLLPVTINKATKIFDYFLKKDKVYRATFKFGIETDTLDLDGNIVKREDVKISENDVLKVLPKLIGKQNQLPPIYSAKKIDGKRAYDLARSGEEVKLKPKEIEIYDLKLLSQLDENEFLFEIHCSSGTYIRSLCRDMASLLSTCGVMSDIIRTKCGNLFLADAYTIEEVKSGRYELLKTENLFDYEPIFLNEDEFFKVSNGVIIERKKENGDYKVFFDETFVGIGNIHDKKLKISLRMI